ncbi:MAG TPA: topoisomerase C-terminal repeat-containing protein, partial [Caulobacteraceae bacterium]|nr:topoisomerase C-terminal repeat-containing protein [Caulobacteraceae bacterium]
IGRYGPYVQHQKTYANLPNAEEVFEVGLNRAVALLAEKRAGNGRGRGAASPGRELGAHPETGKPIKLMAGRYGPYVKHEDVNATLPKGADPEALTLTEAVALIAARGKQAGGGGHGRKIAKAAAGRPNNAAKAAPAAKPAARAKASKGAGAKKAAAKPKSGAAPKKSAS